MIEILMMPFMQRALLTGLIIALLGSYYGVFIIQRKMGFLGTGLAHAAFGGVALGLLLNTGPLYTAVPFTVIIALLITWLNHRTKLGADTSVGILFSLSVALGIIFISLKDEYSVDAFTYLFGSILAVDTSDIYAAAGLGLITLIMAFRYWGRWAYAGFDREIARADIKSTSADDYLLSVMLALVIVISIKLVGIILISAFLVIPAASSRMISKTFRGMTIWSISIGVFGAISGLVLSVYYDLPSGASIVVLQALIFLVCYIKPSFQKKK